MADRDLRVVERGATAHPDDVEGSFRVAIDSRRAGNPVTEYSGSLDNVLQQSNGSEFEKVRDEFPEYVDDLACRLVDCAQISADKFTSQQERERAYSKMAGSLAPHNLTKAQQLADKITDPTRRESAYERMAVSLASHDLTKALQLVEDKIIRPGFREWAYTELAGSLGLDDLTKALQLVEDKIIRPDFREWAYAELAGSLAPHDLTKAQQLADKITNRDERERTQENINYLGIPDVCNLVRSAQFEKIDELLPEEPEQQVNNYCEMIKGLSK